MSAHYDGFAAFPSRAWGPDEKGFDGMSLRDYFAAKVMSALIAADSFNFRGTLEEAKYSYGVADAMLEARKS